MAFVLNKRKNVVKTVDYIFVPNKPVEVTNVDKLKKTYPELKAMFDKGEIVEIDKTAVKKIETNLAGEPVKKESAQK